jgi:hypothetical protein
MFRFDRVAMVAALLIGVSALAQDAPGSRQPAGSPSAQKKPSNRPLRGDIQSVDIEAKTLTVQAKKGGELVTVVVETDPQTQFTLDQKKITLVDLRAGMKVVVLPDVGVAAKVTATSAKYQPKRTAGKNASPDGESTADSSAAADAKPAPEAKAD